jgi:hypothetical protein
LSGEACGALGASSGIAYNYTQCTKKFPRSDYATMGSLALWTFGERKTVVEKVTRDARSEHRTQLHQATRTPPLRVERHSAARETDHMARIGWGLVIAFPFVCALTTAVIIFLDERKAKWTKPSAF